MTNDFNFLAGEPPHYLYLSSTRRCFEGVNHLLSLQEKNKVSDGVGANNICTICNTAFQIPTKFQEHMAEVHQKHKPYMCSLCGKCYAGHSGLSLHLQAHDGKSYVCPICNSKFSQNSTMKRHLKCMHNTNQCSVCKGIFKLGPEYNQHVLHCKP